MSALQDAVKHILYSADTESDRKWGTDAAAELEEMQAKIERVEKLVAKLKARADGDDRLYADRIEAALRGMK